jgi:putative lipoprotein
MTITHSICRTLFFAPILLVLAACGGAEDEMTEGVGTVSTISGEVFYRERMMLPPGAEVEVQLQDVSKADALATVMASVMFTPEGGPPYPFAIEYNTAAIDERMRYSLRATITVGDKLMFTSTEFIDPFSGEALSIMLQRVPEPVERSPSEPEPEPEPENAPAPDRDPAEAAESTAAKEESQSDAPMWVLDTLGGEAAPAGAGGSAIDLALNAADGTASGFSGCNRYQGSFSNEGKSTHGTPLKFGPMASTLRACADGDQAERDYLKMLGAVDAYRMQGDSLALLQGSQVVATFKMR